jgi:GGDEF domain-containing protein
MAPESAILAPDDLSDLGGQLVYHPQQQANSAPPSGSDDLSDLGGKLVYHPQQAAQQQPPTSTPAPQTAAPGGNKAGLEDFLNQQSGRLRNTVLPPTSAPLDPILRTPPKHQETEAEYEARRTMSPEEDVHNADLVRNIERVGPGNTYIDTTSVNGMRTVPGRPLAAGAPPRPTPPPMEPMLTVGQAAQQGAKNQAGAAPTPEGIKAAGEAAMQPLVSPESFRTYMPPSPLMTKQDAAAWANRVIDPEQAKKDDAAYDKAHPTEANIRAGVNDFLSGQTSPFNMGLLLAGPIAKGVVPAEGAATAATRWASRLMSAYFAEQMAQGTYQSGAEAYKAFKAGKNDEATKFLTGALLSGGMTLMAAHHATSGAAKEALEGLVNIPEADRTKLRADLDQLKAEEAARVRGNVPRVPRETPQAESTTSNITIGDTEPETGRTVMQQSPKPEVSQAAATAEHPDIKSQITAAVKPVEGAKLAGERDEKTPERVEEKIKDEGQSARTMRDFSGFRVAVDSPQAAEQAVAALRKNFEVVDESNEFHEGNPETGFHGWTVQVREPGSPVSHEVQVVPREVAETADTRHPLYEKAREGDKDAAAELKQANEQDWQKFQSRQGVPATPQEPTPQPAAAQPAAQPQAPAVERRSNEAERKRVSEMTPEEMQRTLLTSDVTGLPNRRAYDEAERSQPAKAVAMSDADGLKALNDKLGYEAGNALLRAKAEALQNAGLDAYHEKGDEFLFRGESPEALQQKLEQAREDLRNRTIEVTLADGSKRQFKGADFSYGTGQDSAQAEAGLKEHKQEREARGERARGELRGITEVGSEGREAVPSAAPRDRFRELTRQREERPSAAGAGGEETDLFGNPVKRPAGPVAPGDVGRMDVGDLKLDPKRFQYKMNTDASGVTNLLKGRKWNEDLAGIISVWRDPENGQTYVVNGHHRFQLAQENHRPNVTVRMIDAPTAEAARATGALQNIAEGRGTAMDAAKFFRDSGFTPERLSEIGISMTEATAANGVALARLDPSLFDQVVTGKLPEGRAIAIGNATANPAEQEAILKLITKAEGKGKHVTNETVNELARMVKGAGEHTSSQATLFGTQEMTHNLALEKAEISSYIRKEIGTERRTFESVSDEKRAKRLGTVEGQKITAAENAQIAEKARHAQELYDRLSVRSGNIDEILNRAARELAEGGRPNDVKARAYEDVRKSLAETLRTGADGGREGVQEKPRAASQQSGQQPRAAETGQPPRTIAKGAPVTLADGKAGVIEHYQPGVNGGPERVRVRLTDGTMREGVKPQDVKPIPAPEEHPGQEWIGVDFDKTLAHYDTFKGPEYTGAPLPEMVDRVKKALADGKNVKIFTARVADDPTGRARAALEAWSQEHIGRPLPITNVKDQYMSEIWDDRARQAVPNTGRMVEGNEANAQNEPARGAQGTQPPVARENPQELVPRPDERGNARTAAEEGARQVGDDSRNGPRPAGAQGSQRDILGGRSGAPESVAAHTDREPAGAARRAGESAADLQERLLAKGRFNRELQAARGRKAAENVGRAQVETRDVNGHQVHVLNPDAYAFLERQLTPGNGWIGATLDQSAASRWIAELRAAESIARQKRLPQVADGFKKLALQLDGLRDPDGGLVLLRGDFDDATLREEMIHRWQQRTGLYGSAALDAITRLPEVERALQGLDEIGYKGVALPERTAEALAKALAGDPDWTLSSGARRELVRRFLTAAVDEMGVHVLDNLPPVLPELEPTIREVQEYGRQQTQGEGPRATRRGTGEEGQGLPGLGESEGRASNPPGQRGPVPERTGEAVQQNRSAKDKLGELFRRRRGQLRPEDSLALPGMEDADRQRADAEAAEQGKLLTEAMRQPKGDISQAAGEMERDSPLFFGTGDNPTLFKRDPQAERENPWFLKSERVVADKMKGPMPAEDLKRMLENNGVRAEEMKWSGLDEFLSGKGRNKVTADEVAQAIRDSAIKVEDVWHAPISDEEMSRRIANGEGLPKTKPTRYSDYVEPGGEDYKELLLTLPSSGKSSTRSAAEIRELPDGRFEARVEGDNMGRFGTREEAERVVNMYHGPNATQKQLTSPADFKSGHWDEPNILAHVRMNDRPLEDGRRALHVEEIQSDWHQQGRERGYRLPPKESAELEFRRRQLEQMGSDARERGEDVSAEVKREWADIMNRLQPENGRRVPVAPFAKDWHEMALRRMLQHAVENGYDAMTWTPGEMQASRYSLSKRIGEVRYVPETNMLLAEDPSGAEVIRERVPPDKLPDYLGKEAAQRLLATEQRRLTDHSYPQHVLSGIDLKVGGEGMHGFYDKIVPDYLNKFGKQFGARVEKFPMEIPGQERYRYTGPDRTLDDVAKLHEASKTTSYDQHSPITGERQMFAVGRVALEQPLRAMRKVMASGMPFKDALEQHGTPEVADWFGGKMDRTAPRERLEIPGISITDKMRESLAETGVPLFKREPATTVTTGHHDTGKAIEDTVRELDKIPTRKLSPAERIDEASKLAVEQAKGAATGIAKAGASLKGTWAGVVDSANSPAPWTSFFESLKGLRQGEFRAALELDKYQKRMREVAPSPRERAAMTIFGEARNEQELKQWADQARQMAKYRGTDAEKTSAAKVFAKHLEAFEDAQKLTGRQKQIAAEHARYYDQQLELLMDAGLLHKGASRYAMHMFAGDPEALAQAQAVTDFSELAPNPAFLKRRVYPSYFDAMTHGEMPRTLDSGKILSAYHDAFTKTFLTRGFLRSLIEAHDEEDGRPLAALESRAGFSYVKDDSPEAKQIIRQPRRPDDLSGYVRIPASQLKNFKWELSDADRELLAPGYKDLPEAEQQKLFGGEDSQYPSKPGEILALRGDVLVHPKYAGRVSDLLMRSALDRAQQDPVLETGRKAVRAIQQAGAKLKSGILTYSLFHQTQLGVHALEHMTNPMRLGELSELAKDPTVMEGVGHGLNLLNVDSEGVLASHLGLPGMETYHRYLFRDYIPRLKAETYKNAFRRNLKRYSGELTRDEIHLMTAKQVNNGFGGLDPAFFRHLYRMNNKTWRSLEHLAFFSPDFTKARLGFVGQAFGKYGQEQRMALGLGLITLYSVARITNALLNQGDAHWNWRDALQVSIPKNVPLVGGQRVGLRTVQADMLNLIKDPKTFAYNRLNPITLRPTIEFLTGRDNMGRQQTTAHFAKNYAKQMTPIPVQKLFTTSDDRWADALLQSAGLESGKYRTPLETVAHKLYVEGLPDMPEDEDKQNEARERVQRVEELRRLADDPKALEAAQNKVWDDAKAGKMTERQAKAMLERASMTELQYEVSRMKKMEDALTVWDQASAGEREELRDVMEQKAARQTKNMDEEQAAAFITKLKDKGIGLE